MLYCVRYKEQKNAKTCKIILHNCNLICIVPFHTKKKIIYVTCESLAQSYVGVLVIII